VVYGLQDLHNHYLESGGTTTSYIHFLLLGIKQEGGVSEREEMGIPSTPVWQGMKHNGSSFHIDSRLKTREHGEGFKGFRKK
jgi:hypothetical protein